jgi:uncharacterized protein (DUF302 family)
MSYYFLNKLDCSFEAAKEKVIEVLKSEGFGVLTEIDVQSTLKKKIDVDFYRYQILGACNPNLAYQALQIEDKIGTMLPCNVILQQKNEGEPIEVSAVDPAASMKAIENPHLGDIAVQVRGKLQKVIENLN